jgi:hypothetical protein
MDDHDRDALTRALDICRAESPGRAQQIDSMLQDQPWLEVAKYAAHFCQHRSLRLLPWETEPMYGDVDLSWRDDDAARLLHQMLALGISKFEPDPMAAIEKRSRTVTPYPGKAPA